ncbi:MAG: GNAT family N-acetyltransferase [Spirochaetaceae bacterium]|nr:GNAT family N-acetyltransferase [Spirochaetaceae bacterium]
MAERLGDPKIKLVDAANLAGEHICCAISDAKCRSGYEAKKAYLRQRFAEGLVFKKFDVRHKVFIEYGPAESAWLPVEAPGYTVIDCFWVAGAYAGKGHGAALLRECIEASRGGNGVIALSSAKKRPFLADKAFLAKAGFEVCDQAGPYFELLVRKNASTVPAPRFLEPARTCSLPRRRKGLVAYFSARCPYTDHYVREGLAAAAGERGIPFELRRIESRADAMAAPSPFTIFSLFRDGVFVTHEIPAPSKLAGLLDIEKK